MKIHFSSSRGKTKSHFSSGISRDRDSCQGLPSSHPAGESTQVWLPDHLWQVAVQSATMTWISHHCPENVNTCAAACQPVRHDFQFWNQLRIYLTSQSKTHLTASKFSSFSQFAIWNAQCPQTIHWN